MAAVIDQVGRLKLPAVPEGESHFVSLARAIVYQQLSGKAAATIWGRVAALCGGRATPEGILAATEAELRACGLSRQKLSYVRDLAGRAHVMELDRLEHHEDLAIIERLTAVKGIGLWTAQMFLMFRLRRPDVLPALDLGIQKAVQKAYRMRSRPTPKKVEQIGEAWRPWATVACWYLWRSLD